MADAPSETSFENLNHSGLISLVSKDNKDVKLSLEVFRGNTSLVIFTGGGGKPWKVALPQRSVGNLRQLLLKMQSDPQPQRQTINISDWVEGDNNKRQLKARAAITVGIDETFVPFIEVAANDLQGRHLFLVRSDARWDFGGTTLTEKDNAAGLLDYLIEGFSLHRVIAERVSSFKRTGGGGGGGGRGGFGGGGGGNRGGGFGGGGGGRPQQTSFGGGGGNATDELNY
jgi:hypothetical protein